MQKGPVWIIDDDRDDREMVKDIFMELGIPNELVFLAGAEEALDRLASSDQAPFIIISDVNLPKIDGFELRERMLQNPAKNFHSVPFIFWSDYASEKQIVRAFDLSAHGFFIKDANYPELKTTFINIIQYWQKSRMPSAKNV